MFRASYLYVTLSGARFTDATVWSSDSVAGTISAALWRTKRVELRTKQGDPSG